MEPDQLTERIRALLQSKVDSGEQIYATDPQIVVQQEDDVWCAMVVSHVGEGRTEMEALRMLESKLRTGEQ